MSLILPRWGGRRGMPHRQDPLTYTPHTEVVVPSLLGRPPVVPTFYSARAYARGFTGPVPTDGGWCVVRLVGQDGSPVLGRFYSDAAGADRLQLVASSPAFPWWVAADGWYYVPPQTIGAWSVFVEVRPSDPEQTLRLEAGWSLSHEPFEGAASCRVEDPVVSGGGSVTIGPQTALVYVVSPSGGLAVDPTVVYVAADAGATDHTQHTVMHIRTVPMPAGVPLYAIGPALVWTTRTSSGTGSTYWAISTAAESVGSAPVAAVSILQSIQSATNTTTTHHMSGLAPSAALPTGPFKLLLIGKPDTAGQTLAASIATESSLELSY